MPAGTMLATVAGVLALTLLLTPAVDGWRHHGAALDGGGAADGDVAAIEAGAGARPGRDGQPTVAAPPPGSTGGTPGALRLATPTRDRPLRLWIATDTTTMAMGLELQHLAEGAGLFTVDREARDGVDWPARLAGDAVAPDVAVVMFGADAAGPAPGDDLRHRVAATMDALRPARGDRLVMWVGVPAAGSDAGAEAHAAAVNAVYAGEAARRPWVQYVDAFPFLSDPFGRYASDLVNADGRTRAVRADDGVALSTAGGSRVARAVYTRLGTLVDLRAAPLPADPAAEAPPNVVERDASTVMAAG
jgi:hypothetical protein